MKGEDIAEFEITERTEPFTLDEVFSFIDDTNISKKDAHELKSRIVDAVQGIREKVIDEFAERLKTSQDAYSWCCYDGSMEYCNGDHCEDCMEDFKEKIDKIAEQLKGGAE